MFNSSLFNQDTFYNAFTKDLENAKRIVIIESPFITKRRIAILLPILRRLRAKDIRIVINTKPFEEHEPSYREQAVWAVGEMQNIDIEVFMTVGHHCKLAIIDSDILWEGSLNILYQNDSCEIMRRIISTRLVAEMMGYTGINNW